MREDLLWKGLASASAILAAVAARNASNALWKGVRGNEPPENPADPTTSWGEALAWTMFVGALAGLARVVARRGAASAWTSIRHTQPPALRR